MNAIVLGATGLCGSSLLKYCECSGKFSKVYTLGRRSLPFKSNAIQLIDQDNEKWEQLYPDDNIKFMFTGLATTRGAEGGFQNQYKIDHDLNLELAKVAKNKGCSTIVLVSSMGANVDSRLPYFRMKGEIEKDIIALDFNNTIILRPGALLGERIKSKGILTDVFSKMCSFFYRTRFQSLLGYPVHGDEVAKVGVYLALNDSLLNSTNKVRIVESSEILEIAAKKDLM